MRARNTRINKPRVKRPSKTQRRKLDRGDYILGAVTATLTIGAIVFPWHVYNNPTLYGPPEMAFTGTINNLALSQLDGTQTAFDLGRGEFVATFDDGIDPLIVGAVAPAEIEDLLKVPQVHNAGDFGLIAADSRRALIESSDGIYLVKPFSRLPDGSRVRALRTDEQGQQLITSRFEIIDKANSAN